MKKIIAVNVLCLLLMPGCSQKTKEASVEVPSNVKESFTKLFPSATDVKWSKESATEFEAEFKVVETEKSSNFDSTGKWLVTETEIKISDLPASVQSAINNEFSGYSIEEAEAVETAEAGMFFEVALEKGESSLEVQISADGQVLKKAKKEEAESDEEEGKK